MEVQMYNLNIFKVITSRKDEPSLQQKFMASIEKISKEIISLQKPENSSEGLIISKFKSRYQNALEKVEDLKREAKKVVNVPPEDQLQIVKQLLVTTKSIIEMISNAGQTLRSGDTSLGLLLAAIKLRNYKCPIFYDYNVDPACKIIDKRPSDQNSNNWKVEGAAILYDIFDKSIKLVFDCEYMPVLVSGYKSLQNGELDSTKNSPWPNYYKKCQSQIRENLNVNTNSFTMEWRLVSDRSSIRTDFPIRGDIFDLTNKTANFPTKDWMEKNEFH